MDRPLALAAIGALALVGCGKEDKEPIAAEQVVAEAGKLAQPLPGQYQTRVELIAFSVPGLPDAQAERIRGMMGDIGGDSSFCLTPEEAAKGFEEPIRKISQGQGGLTCEFDEFAVNGGKLAAELSCTGAQGISAEMDIDGTATSQGTSMRMAITQKAAMIPGGEMRMELQMDSRRTGECAT